MSQQEASLASTEGPEHHVGDEVAGSGNPPPQGSNDRPAASDPTASEPAPMSKNALKRLRKQQEWEDGRGERSKRRKEKRHERKERWREARNAAAAQDPSADSGSSTLAAPTFHRAKPVQSTLVPLALILDCDFEKYMTDKERVSLAGQVVRCYADNRSAKYRSHLWIGGWRGKMKERFETALHNSHQGWKGVGFCEGDFVDAAADATQKMAAADADEVIAPLQRSRDHPVQWTRDEKDPYPLPDPEPVPREEHRNIVYLTSESPYTLERLEPNTCYVIGGLVDKNREKGLCYRRARERGIRTARLPIGKFMVMQSRQVLATNHVVEIMLKWLEFEDWGKAFAAVIPKRKGGVLRSDGAHNEGVENSDEEEDDESAKQSLAADVTDAQITEALPVVETENEPHVGEDHVQNK